MPEGLKGSTTLMAVGDVGPTYAPGDELADLVAPLLKQADLRFGQCERTYSRRGFPPQYKMGPGGQHSRLDPSLASVWETAGFDVISLAGNHSMDWGPDALTDTIEHFRKAGKHVIGAGVDIDDARRPAIVESKGVKIAFLAYCSVLRDGEAAGPGKVGVAPMRAHTYYYAEDYMAGSPARVVTEPYPEDLEALVADIRTAKQQADVVVVSLHWGLRMIPKTICDYQPIVAHASIDAGADLILGHHPHVLKAIEVYKGKVCFYSIGNFMCTGAPKVQEYTEWGQFWLRIDAECMPPAGRFFLPSDCRKTLVAKAVIGANGIERVSFIPAFTNQHAQPYPVTPGDPRYQDVVDYVEWVSNQYPHTFVAEGDEVVVDVSGTS
jgi:poly-gamma-glutamate capsule biosynthesis protein CapA/YwtB (metallophosphatase superfamily)